MNMMQVIIWCIITKVLAYVHSLTPLYTQTLFEGRGYAPDYRFLLTRYFSSAHKNSAPEECQDAKKASVYSKTTLYLQQNKFPKMLMQ